MKTEAYPGSSAGSASALPPAISAGYPAEDDVARKLARIWQEQLALEAVGPEDNFFDLGGDSSLAVRIFAQIDQIFGVKLPLATLYEAPTICELAKILRGEVDASGWKSLVTIQSEGSRPKLFCMHGAGGTVLLYRELSAHLGDDQPFYGLQSQGLDGSCAPLTTIEAMAAVYVKEIRKAQPHGPYFISGYCMGGTVAYEVAQQLNELGETVAMLAMFDTMNWHNIPLNLWIKSSYYCQRVYFHAVSFLSTDSQGKRKFIREKLRVAKNRLPVWKGNLLARFGKSASGDSSNSLLLAKIWVVNDRASWTYTPKPFAATITDIRPRHQYWVFNKPELKWDRLAAGGLNVIILPVNPASMLVEPFVKHLAAAVRQSMDAAISRRHGAAPATGISL